MNKIDALFISDVHLGSKFSKVNELFNILDEYKPRTLFIVGDFIDGWLLLRMNSTISFFRKLFHMTPISFSKIVKHKVKNVMNFINTFEDVITLDAINKQCDTVICGHIHTPKDSIINNIRYLNTGDWVESKSYIIFNDNKFELKYAN